jgi:hypothetical protein
MFPNTIVINRKMTAYYGQLWSLLKYSNSNYGYGKIVHFQNRNYGKIEISYTEAYSNSTCITRRMSDIVLVLMFYYKN